MVFSSVPVYLDPPNWNQQPQQQQQQQQAHHGQLPSVGGGGGGGTVEPHHHQQQHQLQPMPPPGGAHLMAPRPDMAMVGAAADGAGGVGGPTGGSAMRPGSMTERARMANIPQPEPGLKCPRCESTNTKFCYFNNYSLSQPRHFCRACRRYWTRGGALRNVPVGGGYRRHAKRAKPKQSSAAATTTATASALATPGGGGNSTSSTSCTTANGPASLSGPGPMLGGNHLSMLPPLLRLADFDAMSLGSSFTGIGVKPTIDAAGNYSIGGGGSGATGLEQWRMHQQMQGFPFLHAMDQQGSLPPSLAMVMPGAFQLGLDTDGRGAGGTGNGEEELNNGMPATKREGATGYPRGGMYADHHHHLAAAGYTTSYSNATGNHLL